MEPQIVLAVASATSAVFELLRALRERRERDKSEVSEAFEVSAPDGIPNAEGEASTPTLEPEFAPSTPSPPAPAPARGLRFWLGAPLRLWARVERWGRRNPVALAIIFALLAVVFAKL